MQNGVRHGALVDIFEVLEHHGEDLVVKCAVVAKILEDLPGLHKSTDSSEAVEVRAILNQRERRVLRRWILAEKVTVTKADAQGQARGLLLLSGRSLELRHGIEEVGRVLAVGLVLLELGVDRQDVVQSVDGVVLKGLLTVALLVLDHLLLEEGEAYYNNWLSVWSEIKLARFLHSALEASGHDSARDSAIMSCILALSLRRRLSSARKSP